MKVYLCGPMTGLPDYNYPLFREWTQKLEEMGYEVLSPHVVTEGIVHEGPTMSKLRALWGDSIVPWESEFLWAWCMRRTITQLMSADVVALLPLPSSNWVSKGRDKEIKLAKTVKIPVFNVEDFPIGFKHEFSVVKAQ